MVTAYMIIYKKNHLFFNCTPVITKQYYFLVGPIKEKKNGKNEVVKH